MTTANEERFGSREETLRQIAVELNGIRTNLNALALLQSGAATCRRLGSEAVMLEAHRIHEGRNSEVPDILESLEDMMRMRQGR